MTLATVDKEDFRTPVAVIPRNDAQRNVQFEKFISIYF